MASAWPVHGQFMASAWPNHEQFCILTPYRVCAASRRVASCLDAFNRQSLIAAIANRRTSIAGGT
eukprot:5140581-Lingulodinium_polyedra.AAC.1